MNMDAWSTVQNGSQKLLLRPKLFSLLKTDSCLTGCKLCDTTLTFVSSTNQLAVQSSRLVNFIALSQLSQDLPSWLYSTAPTRSSRYSF